MAEVSGWFSSNQRYRDDSLVSCGQHLNPSDLQYDHNKSQVRVHSLFDMFLIHTRPDALIVPSNYLLPDSLFLVVKYLKRRLTVIFKIELERYGNR